MRIHFWVKGDTREGVASERGYRKLRDACEVGAYDLISVVECSGCPLCRGVRGYKFVDGS